MAWQLYQGDALTILKSLPEKSINCCITSPPYYGLRDYGLPPIAWPEVEYSPMSGLPPIKIPAWEGQLGLELTPEMYTAHLVLIFREVRRVLRDDGTLWLNLGDSYAGSGGAHAEHHNNPGISNSWKRNGVPHYGKLGMPQKYIPPMGLKAKDLIGVPWRVAFALQADGWWLRSDIFWVKMNAMPSSVKDRPGVAHEYFFLFSKSRKYFYDAGAVRKERATHENRPDGVVRDRILGYDSKLSKIWGRKQDALGKPTYTDFNDRWKDNPTVARNRRTSDWFIESLDALIEGLQEYLRHLTEIRANSGMLLDDSGGPLTLLINTYPFKGAHFAVFNERLITPCILASTSPMACPECGAPWERVVQKPTIPPEAYLDRPKAQPGNNSESSWLRIPGSRRHLIRPPQQAGWRPTCSCPSNNGSGRCVVLDPFAGSGTTLLVAESLGRDSIGVELNPEYCSMIEERMKDLKVKEHSTSGEREEEIKTRGAVLQQLSLF